MKPTKILILTADAGFGHRSTANALCRAFDLRYGDAAQVIIVNPLDGSTALSFLRSAESDYDKLAREWPQFYKLGYKMTDLSLTTNVTEMAYVMMMYDNISRLMKQHDPDVVVITFPTYQYPISAYRRLGGRQFPIVTVVTDLISLQKMWFSQATDLCLVPTDVAAGLAQDRGLEPDAIRVTGLPVNPELADTSISKADARRALGWPEDKFTVLVVGSNRIEGLSGFTHILNHSGFDIHLAAVAGGNEALYSALQDTDWHISASVYDFVKDMPSLMRAADCIVSKAGGLIITESLACGLPLIIMKIIPGQETGNAQYIVEQGAGDVALEPLAFLETMAHWMADDRRVYRERAANAVRLGRPRAAIDAAELIWQTVRDGVDIRPSRIYVSKEKLKTLLRQFSGNEKPAPA